MQTPTIHIRQCFDQHLIELLPELGLNVETGVAWTNASFIPVANAPYLQPFYLLNPTQTRSLGIDGFERADGIYQINICVPKDTSTKWYEEAAIKIIEAFRGGTRFACCNSEIRITTAYYGNVFTDSNNNRLICPVSIVWYCYFPKG